MNIRKEIDKFALVKDKPALRWLFGHYHMRSNWFFVAECTFEKFGAQSYQARRVWTPTVEGWILYKHLSMSEVKKCLIT